MEGHPSRPFPPLFDLSPKMQLQVADTLEDESADTVCTALMVRLKGSSAAPLSRDGLDGVCEPCARRQPWHRPRPSSSSPYRRTRWCGRLRRSSRPARAPGPTSIAWPAGARETRLTMCTWGAAGKWMPRKPARRHEDEGGGAGDGAPWITFLSQQLKTDQC